jgi:hypothetical protein
LENNKKCNPSYVKFEKFWKFFVKLKVYDEFDSNNFVEKILYFENREKIKDSKLQKKEVWKKYKNIENTKIKEDIEKISKKERQENGEFYIYLQWKLKKNILWERWKINYFTKKIEQK